MKHRLLTCIALVVVALGCGPSVPAFPSPSAAAEGAAAAPIGSVATALREDPNERWVGLQTGNAAVAGHHHMPGMDMNMNMDMNAMDGGHGP